MPSVGTSFPVLFLQHDHVRGNCQKNTKQKQNHENAPILDLGLEWALPRSREVPRVVADRTESYSSWLHCAPPPARSSCPTAPTRTIVGLSPRLVLFSVSFEDGFILLRALCSPPSERPGHRGHPGQNQVIGFPQGRVLLVPYIIIPSRTRRYSPKRAPAPEPKSAETIRRFALPKKPPSSSAGMAGPKVSKRLNSEGGQHQNCPGSLRLGIIQGPPFVSPMRFCTVST